MTVMEYVMLHPGLTSGEIARGLGRTASSVGGSLTSLYNSGSLVRETNDRGESVYRVNDMPFGCANRLTMIFNQRLSEARNRRDHQE
ncbi:MarR family transcriptional regulator [Salmonella enterica]|nr:MarR family transcriptional regulator [Salmonella enterica]EBF7359591.1 MarR family transcriptional regulator [Salmonella enterica subsp. enterica serovar Edinburgh]EBH8904558.1 MarR family transcriptional regulator [Salmonella enterica subsp. enterica serovar 6,7:b:-]EBH8909657.1 MarR family transcriptional regulator [Salmonella enterica subsp. enterica serovar Santiago]ECC3801581.1 MarR family transcriptional regulator [Salmonella enterica subsp. enterica]ECI4632531.1 MarR family transcri